MQQQPPHQRVEEFCVCTAMCVSHFATAATAACLCISVCPRQRRKVSEREEIREENEERFEKTEWKAARSGIGELDL